MTKTKRSTRSASPTTTAGFTSSESLAEKILLSAQSSQRSLGWLGRLSQEQRDVVVDVKRRWRETKEASGVSAAHLARTIVASMPECSFPKNKEIAAWLHREQ